MAKLFLTTSARSRRRRPPRRRYAWRTAVLLGVLLPLLVMVPPAQALRGLGRLFGHVHDQAREQVQLSLLAEEQAKLALLRSTNEALVDLLDEALTWDSLRVAWLGAYARQLVTAPAFDYETAPLQQRRFEKALSGRDAALLALMDDPVRRRSIWTGHDPSFTQTGGDPWIPIRQATQAALGAQTGAVAVLNEAYAAFEVDADEVARFGERIGTLASPQQMRDLKAQGLLLQAKQLQQLRYQIIVATARRAAAYGDKLGSEARRGALYDRLLLPARPETKP